jgi:hypothetical protein
VVDLLGEENDVFGQLRDLQVHQADDDRQDQQRARQEGNDHLITSKLGTMPVPKQSEQGTSGRESKGRMNEPPPSHSGHCSAS